MTHDRKNKPKSVYSISGAAAAAIVLVMYCIVVTFIFIRQSIILIGIVSTYQTESIIGNVVGIMFRGEANSQFYIEGINALNSAGYGSVFPFFMMRPKMPYLIFSCILIIGIVGILVWRNNCTIKSLEEDRKTIIGWIKSGSEDAPMISGYSRSLIDVIAQLKQKLNKQEVLHQEDNAKIMHYMEDISHQLKTPLTVIKLACERLELEIPESSPIVHTCLIQINKLTGFIRDLLMLGRFDCNKQRKNFAYANAWDLLETVVNELEIMGESKNLDFEIIGDPAITWYCDSYWIKEAIGNIIKNCIEHSKDGQIQIKYECNNRMNHISISDNGCGFAPGVEKQIFQRYYIGQTIEKDSAGLGMAIAQEAIKMHYGTVSASNRDVGGAEIKIVFPCFDAQELY